MGDLMTILSKNYDRRYINNQKNLDQICKSQSRTQIQKQREFPLVKAVNTQEKTLTPLVDPQCNLKPNSGQIDKMNFITDPVMVSKMVQYRKLEVRKQIEIFKFNVELFKNLCVHFQMVHLGVSKYTIEEVADLNKMREKTKEYMERFITEKGHYLLKCKMNYIFLEKQLGIILAGGQSSP